jgi:8-oxo-dGTP pyrophosphatase MutT (NUDIX family)
VLSLDQIRRAVAAHRPEVLPAEEGSRAAVAVVLRNSGGAPELLFIERAKRTGDPWSGHMAFPGGWVDPGDSDPQSAAERETLEEVGVDLAGAEPVGRLDDLLGGHAPGLGVPVISAFVYCVEGREPLVPNHEVREAFWVPVPVLLDPACRVDYPVQIALGIVYPGILVGDPQRHVVWGLTYRFLEIFFRVVGHPLPDRPIRVADGVGRRKTG